MGENTKIEWATHTFNPWIGCTKVSPACAHCYAESYAARYGRAEWGPGKPRQRTSAANWRKPLAWDREAKAMGVRPRVFCASLADWLDDDGVPIEWLADLLALIHATPNLDWLLLTKRPGNFWSRVDNTRNHLYSNEPREIFDAVTGWLFDGVAPSNVWIGCTVEDKQRADERIPELLKIPARVRFLSCEPLLGPLEFSNVTKRADAVAQLGRKALDGIHWVIAGGESGPEARPSHPDWFRSMRNQCTAAGVAFLFKQWGEWLAASDSGSIMDRFWASNRKARAHEDQSVVDELDGTHPTVPLRVIQGDGRVLDSLTPMAFEQGKSGMMIMRVGKKAAGRLLDGREWNEVPTLCKTQPNPDDDLMT